MVKRIQKKIKGKYYIIQVAATILSLGLKLWVWFDEQKKIIKLFYVWDYGKRILRETTSYKVVKN